MHEADKELLIRFFQNKCTPEELPRVNQLLQTSEGERLLKDLAQPEWEEPVLNNEQTQQLHDRLKQNVHARIHAKETPEKGVLHQLYRFRHAAIWFGVLLIAGGILWQFMRSNETKTIAMIEKINTSGAPVKYILPDSSELFLAAGSKLNYPESFTGETRTVQLEGEAYFDVRSNPQQPFIINTGDVYTKVLGTSFRISAIKNKPLEVAVATGKVAVGTGNKNLATLTPGNKVTWYANEQKAVLAQVDTKELISWRDGELAFDRLTMEQIALELQKRFGVQIEFIDESVRHNRVSGTFPSNKTIDQVLKALAVAGKFRYEKQNDRFRISQLK